MNDRDKLHAKAAHYRKLARQITDQRMVDVLEELAREYERAAQGSGIASRHRRTVKGLPRPVGAKTHAEVFGYRPSVFEAQAGRRKLIPSVLPRL